MEVLESGGRERKTEEVEVEGKWNKTTWPREATGAQSSIIVNQCRHTVYKYCN